MDPNRPRLAGAIEEVYRLYRWPARRAEEHADASPLLAFALGAAAFLLAQLT